MSIVRFYSRFLDRMSEFPYTAVFPRRDIDVVAKGVKRLNTA